MIVYRYMCKDEYDNIMKLDFDNVGGVYTPKGVSNTFRYKRDERYLHFFKEIESMEFMQLFYIGDGMDYYFCSFDIPLTTLLKNMGKGYYEARGYDLDYLVKREYAIPVSEFNPKWIQNAILDEKKHEINEKAKQLLYKNKKDEKKQEIEPTL